MQQWRITIGKKEDIKSEERIKSKIFPQKLKQNQKKRKNLFPKVNISNKKCALGIWKLANKFLVSTPKLASKF